VQKAAARSEKDEEKKARRIFAHLDALCLNDIARRSLRAFQEEYAQTVGCVALLPKGGRMSDGRGEGVLKRFGRVFSGPVVRKSSYGIGRTRMDS
jgi:hypothetical protein